MQDAASTSASCSSSIPVNLIPDRFSVRRDINVEDAGPSTSTSRVSSIHDTVSLTSGTFSDPYFHQHTFKEIIYYLSFLAFLFFPVASGC